MPKKKKRKKTPVKFSTLFFFQETTSKATVCKSPFFNIPHIDCLSFCPIRLPPAKCAKIESFSSNFSKQVSKDGEWRRKQQQQQQQQHVTWHWSMIGCRWLPTANYPFHMLSQLGGIEKLDFKLCDFSIFFLNSFLWSIVFPDQKLICSGKVRTLRLILIGFLWWPTTF